MSEMRRWLEPVDTDWHERALCRTRGFSPDVWRLFDPVGLDEDKEDAWERASFAIDAFCSVCPVRRPCAAEADAHPWYEGVWGGAFRERRGVIDTDTGMVVAPGEAPPDPSPVDDPRWRPTDPDPIELEPVAAAPPPEPEPEPPFETIRPRRGGGLVAHYVLITRHDLTAANCAGV